MAIVLREVIQNIDGEAVNAKGRYLEYSELDNNFGSTYYSSSLSGSFLVLDTYLSGSHKINLSGFVGSGGSGRGTVVSVDTGSFYVSSSINLAGDTLTFNQGDGTVENVTLTGISPVTSVYDFTNKSGQGPGKESTTRTIVGSSQIATGTQRQTITIPEIADKVLGDEVFITATYVDGGDTDTPITVQAFGQSGVPVTIDNGGNIEFRAGGSTVSSGTSFMYQITYVV